MSYDNDIELCKRFQSIAYDRRKFTSRVFNFNEYNTEYTSHQSQGTSNK